MPVVSAGTIAATEPSIADGKRVTRFRILTISMISSAWAAMPVRTSVPRGLSI